MFEMLSSLLPRKVDDDEDEGSGELHLFGLYCTNHLLLPMLQSWLRRSQRTFQGWRAAAPGEETFSCCWICLAVVS